ncbi:hypothetical protein ACRAWF_35575 [Streptomyces sp. L7]
MGELAAPAGPGPGAAPARAVTDLVRAHAGAAGNGALRLQEFRDGL